MEIDKYESVFRAADKPQFHFQDVSIQKVLTITDLTGDEAAKFGDSVQYFLSGALQNADHKLLKAEQYATVPELLEHVEKQEPDLVCTYRCLRSESYRWPFSLGEYLDVLTQVAPSPILVVPHPKTTERATHAMKNTDSVMAMTDHMAGEDRLVNFAVALTAPGGTLHLAHIEDQWAYERMITAIGKIPGIDTDDAKGQILQRLLQDPADYIQSCRAALAEKKIAREVHDVVTVGRHLNEYLRLIDEHQTDLLVMNTKDDDQLAMHGMAYPLTVEIRSIPLLLL